MPAAPQLAFYGGAGTVTGSKFLVSLGDRRVLLDCGLFQGLKALRLRNWSPPPFDPKSLAAIVLTHAHIDHCGYVPVVVREGFRGPILCTGATADLLRLMLLDSARLQEEEAEAANRGGYSRHHPALPLYTVRDAQAALGRVVARPYGQDLPVAEGIRARFRRAGHILGAASVELQLGAAPHRVVCSGDVGRWGQPILRDPEPVPEADTLLLESTYGDRVHAPDPEAALAQIIHEAVQRGGALIVPSFAVGRAQHLIWVLRKLEAAGRIPELPVFLDSPMAQGASTIYASHHDEHDAQMQALMRAAGELASHRFHIVKTVDESKVLHKHDRPFIIVASSGMATGGRVLEHLKVRLPNPSTTVLLIGYQAAGTRGRSLQEGASAVKIHGQMVPVRAAIRSLDGLSAHADREELLRWLSGFRPPPGRTFLVHGEPQPANALAQAIRDRLGWPVEIAGDGQVVELGAAAG
jgi:metallo-beta-lactamase family protein